MILLLYNFNEFPNYYIYKCILPTPYNHKDLNYFYNYITPFSGYIYLWILFNVRLFAIPLPHLSGRFMPYTTWT